MDFRIRTSSLGRSDGQYEISTYDPTSGSTIESETVTAMSYENTARLYRWFIWQNWVGNGLTSQDTFLDDLFIQVGTQARVELCDKPTWGACTLREVQAPSSWSDGSISLKFNQGGFKPGQTAYLYVVDGSGVASRGMQVAIGGAAAPAPMTPGNYQLN
jgi:hypothetical protein